MRYLFFKPDFFLGSVSSTLVKNINLYKYNLIHIKYFLAIFFRRVDLNFKGKSKIENFKDISTCRRNDF